MTLKSKIVFPLAALALVIIAAGLAKTLNLFPGNGQPGGSQETPLPAATGNADDVVNALLLDSLSERNTIQAEEDDMNLINSDGQEIGDFVKTYNENEL